MARWREWMMPPDFYVLDQPLYPGVLQNVDGSAVNTYCVRLVGAFLYESPDACFHPEPLLGYGPYIRGFDRDGGFKGNEFDCRYIRAIKDYVGVLGQASVRIVDGRTVWDVAPPEVTGNGLLWLPEPVCYNDGQLWLLRARKGSSVPNSFSSAIQHDGGGLHLLFKKREDLHFPVSRAA